MLKENIEIAKKLRTMAEMAGRALEPVAFVGVVAYTSDGPTGPAYSTTAIGPEDLVNRAGGRVGEVLEAFNDGKGPVP